MPTEKVSVPLTDERLLARKDEHNAEVIELARLGLWTRDEIMPLLRSLPNRIYYQIVKTDGVKEYVPVEELVSNLFSKAPQTV